MRNSSRIGYLFVALCGLSTGVAEGQQPPSPPAASWFRPEEADRYKEAVARLVKNYESELAKSLKLQALGAISAADVDKDRERLALARHNQALIEWKADAARDQIEAIIEIRERALGRLQATQRTTGAIANDVRVAERRLAHARYRLARREERSEDAVREMRAIAKFREGELKAISASRGVISEAEVEIARDRLACARYRLAQLEGKSEDAIREARTTAEIKEGFLKQVTIMATRAAASPLEVEYVRVGVHLARQRLAIAQGNPKQARDHLRQYVKSLEEIERGRTGPIAMPLGKFDIAGLAHDIAMGRARLAAAREGMALPDDDPWYEFDD